MLRTLINEITREHYKPAPAREFMSTRQPIALVGSHDRQQVEHLQNTRGIMPALVGMQALRVQWRQAATAYQYEQVRASIGKALSIGGGVQCEYYTVGENLMGVYQSEPLFMMKSPFMLTCSWADFNRIRRALRNGEKADGGTPLIMLTGDAQRLQCVSLLEAVAAGSKPRPVYVSGVLWVEREP